MLSSKERFSSLTSAEKKQIIEYAVQIRELLTQLHDISQKLNDNLFREMLHTSDINNLNDDTNKKAIAELLLNLEFLENYFKVDV